MQIIPTNPYTPFLNQPNYVGQLSLPNILSVASLMDVQGLAQDISLDAAELLANEANRTDEIQPQAASWLWCVYNPYSPQCIEKTIPYAKEGIIPSFGDFIGGVFKDAFLLIFALILVAFGLYMLAKSTDTGAAVINVAKKI